MRRSGRPIGILTIGNVAETHVRVRIPKGLVMERVNVREFGIAALEEARGIGPLTMRQLSTAVPTGLPTSPSTISDFDVRRVLMRLVD